MPSFDPATEAAQLRTDTQAIRKRRYSRSRLDRWKGELLQLQQAGATPAELQRWLRSKRIKVTHSTVSRWLQRNG